jgi:hypothetical protein
MLKEKEVLEQSRAAMSQWEPLWRQNATTNGKIFQKNGRSFRELLFAGMGRSLVCIANGPSLEENIETLIKYRSNVDVMCVDKCMCDLLSHGVKPNYVIIADAVVDYEKYAEPWINETKDITLLCNITANIKWPANWHGPIYFFVNKDNIQSEEIFMGLSGCRDLIPASSNVGNAQVVFATQVMGYDEYILLGYDYCWTDDTNYYSWHDSDKRWWMKHLHMVDGKGNLINSSTNLHFSARWMADYFNVLLSSQGVRVTNCSNRGLLNLNFQPLEKKLKRVKRRMLTEADRDKYFMAHTEKAVATNNDDLNNKLRTLNLQRCEMFHIPQIAIDKWSQICS